MTGIFIPIGILSDSNLPTTAKFIYGIIDYHRIHRQDCRLTNQEIGDILNLHKINISKNISLLKNRQLIKILHDFSGQRILTINNDNS